MKYITESMPHIIPLFNPDWTKNKESILDKLNSLKLAGTKSITKLEATGQTLHQSLANLNSFFVEEDGFLIYYLLLDLVDFEFDTEKSKHKKLSLSQANIWRDKMRPGTTGITSEVFDFLFKKNKSILSDDTQSWDGFNFWHREVIHSLKLNRFIYVVRGYTTGNTTGKQHFRCTGFRKIKNSKDIKDYISDKYYKGKDKFRFLILDKKMQKDLNLFIR